MTKSTSQKALPIDLLYLLTFQWHHPLQLHSHRSLLLIQSQLLCSQLTSLKPPFGVPFVLLSPNPFLVCQTTTFSLTSCFPQPTFTSHSTLRTQQTPLPSPLGFTLCQTPHCKNKLLMWGWWWEIQPKQPLQFV